MWTSHPPVLNVLGSMARLKLESGMIAFLVISIPVVICILPPSIRYPLLELCLKKMRKCWKRMGKYVQGDPKVAQNL